MLYEKFLKSFSQICKKTFLRSCFMCLTFEFSYAESHVSATKTDRRQGDPLICICLSPKCQLRNCSNSSTCSLTFFNNFPTTKSQRIDRNSFVIVSGCNQRRGSILREFFTTIRTTMINRYFILFGMPVVSASKEGSCQCGRKPTKVTKEERKSIVSMHSPMQDVSSIFVNIFQPRTGTRIFSKQE